MMTGEQRYRQATTKARILSNRNLRKFLADEIDWLPQSKDREFIIAEFDRLQAELDEWRKLAYERQSEIERLQHLVLTVV